MPEIDRAVERQRAYVTRELEQFDLAMLELDREILKMASTSAEPERLAASLRTIAKEAIPHDPITEFVDQPAALLRDLHAATDKRSFCPSSIKLSLYLQVFREGFNRALESPEYEVKLRMEAENLSADEGLIVVSFQSNFPFAELVARRVDSKREIRVRAPRSGEHLMVIKARAGEYLWDRVFLQPTYLGLRAKNYTFNIKAGHINYIGMLDFHKRNDFGFSYPRLDRQAYVLTQMEDKMPDLLNRHALHNGMDSDDPYTRFYLQQKQLHAAK